jgi:pimeloyl-ACP methyl ester carboxylesterase
MNTSTSKAIALLVGLATRTDVRAPSAAARTDGPCYVALLHGSGPDLHDQDGSSPAMEHYWNPSGDPARSLAAQARSPKSLEGRCVVGRIGYDGSAQWWHVRAAGRVARSLHDFIDAHRIADGGLILIGHSMGGLVARYIVDNGAGEAPYYNEYGGVDARMDYDLIRRKTAVIITVDTPHTGTEAADALQGASDHVLANGGVALLLALGMVRDSPANSSLTRAYLEAAGAPAGEMADGGRVVPIYTVAGISPRPRVDTLPTRADRRLDLAWSMLCRQRGAINLWGVACRWDFWNDPFVPGDGIVTRSSAHGLWTRGRPGGRPSIGGAHGQWLDLPENHSQGRYTAQSLFLKNLPDR